MLIRRLCRRVTVAAVLACSAAGSAAAGANGYVVHNLVSDIPGLAAHTDQGLVNGWGLAALPAGPWWVNATETDLSALYLADGTPVRHCPGSTSPAAPRGWLPNLSPRFPVSMGAVSAPALFIFATEEGKILGWDPIVSISDAVVARNLSRQGANFKGLAISRDRLYAADFHNARVVVLDCPLQERGHAGRVLGPQYP